MTTRIEMIADCLCLAIRRTPPKVRHTECEYESCTHRGMAHARVWRCSPAAGRAGPESWHTQARVRAIQHPT